MNRCVLCKDKEESTDGVAFDTLDRHEAKKLEKLEEIFNAFLELTGDTTPSLDEFSMAFQQFCWDFLKRTKVMGFFQKKFLMKQV